MADEKIAATETTVKSEQPIATAEPKKEDTGGSPESKVDYRAELEAERAKNAKLEKEKENYRTATIIKDRQLKKRTPEDEELGEVEEEDPADAIADRVLRRIAPALTASTLDQELARVTNNPDLRELIKYHYENSIARKGFDADSIRDDVRKAAAIAGAPRLTIERDEANRALSERKNPPLGGSGRGPETEVSKKPYGWSAEQVETMNKQHKLATGKPFTEQELARSWELAKSGKATAEIPKD